MKILHVIPSVDPKGGGPIEGVKQHGHQLRTLNHTLEIVCLDDPDAPFVNTFPLKVHALGPTPSHYGYNSKLKPWLEQHSDNYDAVVVNGLWQYHGLATWRALSGTKVPYFVFTHGMLDPWFKHTYPLKHLKKWLYWPWAEYRLLRDARAVLFTCEEERLQARMSFWLYKVNEAVINYGTKTPPTNAAELRALYAEKFPELQGKRVLLFLSRIQEKKGCDLTIAAFAKVAAKDPALHLVMAGPDQSGWVATLKAQAAALGIADRISWPGMLGGDLKWGAFYSAEAFVLSSHQENFGIAVAEALGCGLPVLISDKVNIWREIVEDGAGIANPDTLEGTEATLSEWVGKSSPEREAMARQASVTFVSRYTIEAMTNSIVKAIASRLNSRK